MHKGIHSARIQNRTGERAQFVGTTEGMAPLFKDGARVLFETDNDYSVKAEGETVRLHKVKPLDEAKGITVYSLDTFVTRTDW